MKLLVACKIKIEYKNQEFFKSITKPQLRRRETRADAESEPVALIGRRHGIYQTKEGNFSLTYDISAFGYTVLRYKHSPLNECTRSI